MRSYLDSRSTDLQSEMEALSYTQDEANVAFTNIETLLDQDEELIEKAFPGGSETLKDAVDILRKVSLYAGSEWDKLDSESDTEEEFPW